eukprot:gene1979-3846_t
MIAAVNEEAEVVRDLLQEVCNDKLRAWCTRFDGILKSYECMWSMFNGFDPFTEGNSDSNNSIGVCESVGLHNLIQIISEHIKSQGSGGDDNGNNDGGDNYKGISNANCDTFDNTIITAISKKLAELLALVTEAPTDVILSFDTNTHMDINTDGF